MNEKLFIIVFIPGLPIIMAAQELKDRLIEAIP